MIRVLSSKNYPTGNRDRWWYNLSSPDIWIRPEAQINLILYDEFNKTVIDTIRLQLDRNDWYNRIMQASRHLYKGTEIIKVHITKKHGSNQYNIYFGKTEDGVYSMDV